MSPDIESTLILHIGRNHPEVPLDVKMGLLTAKKRRQAAMGVVNVAALAAFGYAFHAGMTTLPNWVLTVLGLVFTANIGLLLWQRKQIDSAMAFLEEDAKR